MVLCQRLIVVMYDQMNTKYLRSVVGSEHEGLVSSLALQVQGLGRTLGPVTAGVTLDQGGVRVTISCS